MANTDARTLDSLQELLRCNEWSTHSSYHSQHTQLLVQWGDAAAAAPSAPEHQKGATHLP
jgi:hypothetical protein